MTQNQILIVEDQKIIANDIKYTLEQLGYEVAALVASGEEAVQKTAELRPDLILMDIRLKGAMDGIMAAEQIRQDFDIPVIYLTAHTDEDTLQRAKVTGPFGYLAKPFEERELYTAIEIALYKHRMERQLKESETRYRLLIEHASDGIFISDREGCYLEVNSKACEMLGYSRAELLQLNVRDLIPVEDLAAVPLHFERFYPGESRMTERRLRRRDGTLITVEISVKMLENGHIQAIARDITRRKRAEETLKKLSSVIEQTTDPVIITNREGVIEYVNPAFEQLTGYIRAEVAGQTPSLLKSGKHGRKFYEGLWQTILSGQIFRATILNRKKNGQLFYEEKTILPLRDEGGNITHFVSTGKDITERIQMEEALRQATDRYRQLFEEAPAMYVINRNEKGIPIIVDCNDLLLKTLGYSREEIVGQPGYKFYTPASQAELITGGGYQRALTGNFVAEERELVTHDGRIIETIVRATPEIDAQGRVTGTRAMYLDISEHKRLQRRLEAIYKLGQELTLLRDEASIIQRVLETAVDSLHFDLASCGLVEAETQQLHYRYGVPQPINLSLSLEGDQGISVEVAQSGQPLNIPDIRQDPRYVPLPEYPQARSELCVPLKIGVRIFGVLDIESTEPHRFTAADQQLLQLLADQAAVALENARLYSETRRQARELALINKATRLMAASLDLQTVLKQSIIAVNPLLETEGAAVLLLDPDDQALVFEWMEGPYLETLAGTRLPLSAGIVGWAARQGESVLVNDVRQDPRFYQGIDELTGLKTRSVLAVPLIFQQQVIGVIEVINKLNGSFTPDDLETLEALASSAAIAIKNAQLYEAEREQYRRLQQSQAQLIQVEKMAALGRLVASIAHEINNPIQAIQNCLALTKEELQEAQRLDKLHFYTDIAKNELDRIAAIVRRMRDFYRSSPRGPLHAANSIDDFYQLSPQELQPVDLQAVLENVLLLANKQLQHNRIEVNRLWSHNLPSIQGSVDHLKQVFLNLVLNAIDAMAPTGGTLTLQIELDQAELQGSQSEPVVCLKFQDTGRGMPPQILARLFEPLFTTKEHGTGFGLFTSYKIVEAHRGQINVESQPGIGTTFTIYLPLQYHLPH